MTEFVFRDDAYCRECEASVVGINDRGGIILDRTIFYATGGGQPGDSGTLEIEGIGNIPVATTVYGEDKTEIVHVPAEGSTLPEPGTAVMCRLDWDKRFGNMRVHTALHLLSAVLEYPVTGGSIGPEQGRLDFDIPDAGLEKDDIAAAIIRMIEEDHAVRERWITDEELAAQPDLVKTMSVKPPMGSGKVRLIEIEDCDLQPCGGTHVASTVEIGAILIPKIEKKGSKNRRVRLALA